MLTNRSQCLSANGTELSLFVLTYIQAQGFFGRREQRCPLMQRQAERHADALRCLEQRAEEEHRALKRETSQLVKAAVATAEEKGQRAAIAE